MAEIDIDATLRWFRFNPKKRLVRRPDDVLPFLQVSVAGGQALMLDTCVYIDQLQGRSPDLVEQLIDVRQVNHSTVSIQELMYSIGALDHADGRTAGAIAEVRHLIQAMRPHRTFAPDPSILGRAAILAGLLCQLQRYSGDHRMRALMDATLFLQAQKLGLIVLTRNIDDFDLLLQLIPSARVLMYRTDLGSTH